MTTVKIAAKESNQSKPTHSVSSITGVQQSTVTDNLDRIQHFQGALEKSAAEINAISESSGFSNYELALQYTKKMNTPNLDKPAPLIRTKVIKNNSNKEREEKIQQEPSRVLRQNSQENFRHSNISNAVEFEFIEGEAVIKSDARAKVTNEFLRAFKQHPPTPTNGSVNRTRRFAISENSGVVPEDRVAAEPKLLLSPSHSSSGRTFVAANVTHCNGLQVRDGNAEEPKQSKFGSGIVLG